VTQNPPQQPETAEMVTVGQLQAPFGVKGLIKLASFTEPQGNILNYRPWYIEQPGAGWCELVAAGIRQHGSGFVLQIATVADRDRAAKLRGRKIAVMRQSLPVPPTDEFYWRDLIGLTVVTPDDEILGRVKNMMETGANDVLVVSPIGPGQTEILIPFIADAVVAVDLEQGRLHVDWDVNY